MLKEKQHGAVKEKLGQLSLVRVKKTKGVKNGQRRERERAVIVYMKRLSSAIFVK